MLEINTEEERHMAHLAGQTRDNPIFATNLFSPLNTLEKGLGVDIIETS